MLYAIAPAINVVGGVQEALNMNADPSRHLIYSNANTHS
jgi:hypothetical protein